LNRSVFINLAQASRTRQIWAMALLAFGAMLLILWLFSPRYSHWTNLNEAYTYRPDTNRAYFTLLQLQNPFIDIDHFSNKVIEWRLLFPIIFHYLKLPAKLFLALPWIGCLLVLWYAATLIWQRTHDLVLASASIIVLGTASWFLTSTAWLAYFDSWYVLGGLILAFSPSWLLVLAAAVLTPWIDERIVFMLPVCLAARAAIHWHDAGRITLDRQQWRIVIAATLPLVAYALLRVAALLWFDPASRAYAATIESRGYPLGPVARGVWMGLRLAWVPVLMLPVLLAAKSRPMAIVVGAASALSLAIGIVLAGDVSRSMSMLIPVALAGLLLLPYLHQNAKRMVIALAVGNLLLPASHVVSSFTIPIFDARYELHSLRSLSPSYHLSKAISAYRIGDLNGVMRNLDYAREVTKSPDEVALAMVMFGELEEKAGRPKFAAIFYQQALATASQTWHQRANIEQRLQVLQDSTSSVEPTVRTR
jgi:hypothetical protein